MRKIFGLITLFISLSVFSQQYNFINYSVENGLAQSQVFAICQDQKGFLWIGTIGGLSKFDGINFYNYSTNDGLLSNHITSIYNDSKGNVWFGSKGGVSFYTGQEIKSITFKDELSENSVLSITEDSNGNIWFTTNGGGVIYYNGENLNYLTLPNGPDNNYVRHIVNGENGKMWLATRNSVSTITIDGEAQQIIEGINATSIVLDGKDVWCSTFGDGIIKYNSGEIQKISTDQGLIQASIRSFIKRKDGSLWFVSKKGISKYLNGQFKNFTTKDGLRDNNIRCVIEDDEGNLFFGSDGGGLTKFTNENFVSYTKKDIIGSDAVMSIIEDQNKNIWLSTYGDGVGVFTSKGYFLYTTENGLGNNTTWCSMISDKPSIWIGTSNGISEFDGQKFTTYDTDDGLNAKIVYALKQDKSGNIWIGTRKGVSLFHRDENKIENLGIGENIRDIYIDEKDYIWFCSSDGLFKYNVNTKNIVSYTEKDNLPSKSVMNIVKDKSGRIWVGTINGLAYYKDDEFVPIKVPGNYSSNNINFLERDKNDNLWIGTNFGLYQVNVRDKKEFNATDFNRYSNLDGLKSLECNQNASFIDCKNNLWFGTSHGLMKYDLNAKQNTLVQPKVLIEGIRLFYESKDLSKYAKGIDTNTGLPKNLVLQYNNNHLTFDFIGIYHTNPDKVKYSFILEGFDDDWQPVISSNSATYSNIPSGEFTFKLRASTDLKNWTTPITFSFEIKPPFWLTWWFFLLVLVAIFIISYLVVLRRKKVKLAKREKQLLVDKSKMLSLEQQALNASMNRHFIFNALNSIQSYINKQDRIAANKYLSSFAKLVRKNLDSSLVNEIYLEDEIERISLYLKLEQMRFQDKFSYDLYVDPNIEPQSIKIPSMLLQPFIENSIWHGILPSNEQGHINISVEKNNNKLIITISDDGIGIDVSLEQKKEKNQHHVSKGMELTKGRINLISKVSNKDCAIKGPYQTYNDKNEVSGTEVCIVLTL